MATLRRSNVNSFDEDAEADMMEQSEPKSFWGNKLFSLVIILIVIVFGLYFVSRYTTWNVLGVDKSDTTWQSVFLTNGQVYFGKITRQDSKTVTLKEIYYLQVAQSPLQPQDQAANSQQPISLVKLGNELHGPYDEMFINRQQVLFVENMKPDSKVVQAILSYKKANSLK